MKTAVATLCLVLLVTTIAFGQQTGPQAAQWHKGQVKLWTGLGLVAAGLLVMPATAGATKYEGISSPAVGFGLAVAGGSLIWWGVRDQRKAAQPHTTFGLMLGRKSEIQVRRRW